MLTISELLKELEKIAPLSLSEACKAQGDYDNSGIIINSHTDVNKVMFSLDLSIESVKKAKKTRCDTIVTHHPAIYYPLKEIGGEYRTKAVKSAIENKINVISMHLNLDTASYGIDYCLGCAVGGENQKILSKLSDTEGYGREISVQKTAGEIIKTIKRNLGTNKVLIYGNANRYVEKTATFCGAGGGYISNLLNENKIDADLIVSSDVPHHVITQIVESGKILIVVTHYSSEDYGFKKFYDLLKGRLCDRIETYYFTDKRFV